MNTSFLKKSLLIVGVLVLAVGLYVAGFYSRGKYDQQQAKAAEKVGAAFVQDLMSGKTSEAYGLTSKSLQSKQNKDSFTKTTASLKTDKPTYEGAQSTSKDGHYYYSQKVLGLPASESGNTTASFFLVLDQQGSGWKVSQVTVN